MKLQTVIWKLEKKIELPLLAKASYRRLGVFIDLRCQLTENVKLALNEVKKYEISDLAMQAADRLLKFFYVKFFDFGFRHQITGCLMSCTVGLFLD